MAFDGITINCLVNELKEALTGARITKISQPEEYELLLTYKGKEGSGRLFLTANASLPYFCLTEENKPSPLTAPNFCMVLRKHLSGARVLNVEQISLERVMRITLEHLNELGDLCTKYLYVEIMGKHSNIIFTDSADRIIDAIKHISFSVSSVREVLPGREYFIPLADQKADPGAITDVAFSALLSQPLPIFKAIYTGLTGFSPVMAHEICYRAGVDGDASCASLSEDDRQQLWQVFTALMDAIEQKQFAPYLYRSGDTIKDFSAIRLTVYEGMESEPAPSMSAAVDTYYRLKNRTTNISQRSADLRKQVSILLDRANKKLLLQQKQLEDTEKMDTYRVYGELLNTYGYTVAIGDREVTVDNYYTGQPLTIPLDATQSAGENAKRYFEKYNKLKRTAANLTEQTKETAETIEHLSSILSSLLMAESQADLNVIHDELYSCGYVKKRTSNKRRDSAEKSKPLHYVTADGFDIYVGKNNYQNDELTFKLASGNDWWFHAKKVPGSHVILHTGGREVPDHVFEIAASVAAYYSSVRDSGKVDIDYLQKKNVKKPNHALPGFVVYYTNYSMMASADLSEVKKVD